MMQEMKLPAHWWISVASACARSYPLFPRPHCPFSVLRRMPANGWQNDPYRWQLGSLLGISKKYFPFLLMAAKSPSPKLDTARSLPVWLYQHQ